MTRESFNLRGRLSLDGQSFLQGIVRSSAALDRLERSTRVLRRNLAREFDGIRTSASAIGKGVGIASAALVGFGALADKVLGVADQINEISTATGVGVESIQALRVAFEGVGLTIEQIPQALNKSTVAAQKAVNGDKALVAVFEQLGIRVDDLLGKNPEQIFNLITDASQKTENTFVRNSSLAKIFGDRLTNKLIPALSDGAAGFRSIESAGKSAGYILSADLLGRASAAAGAIDLLKSSLAQAGLALFAEFAPQIQFATEKLQGLLTNIPQIKTSILNTFEAGAKAAGIFLNGIQMLRVGVLGIELAFRTVELGFIRIGQSVDELATKALEQLGLIEKKSPQFALVGTLTRDAEGNVVSSKTKPVKVEEPANFDPAVRKAQEAEKLIEKIRKKLSAPLPSQNIEKYFKELRAGTTVEVTPIVLPPQPGLTVTVEPKIDEKKLKETTVQLDEFAQTIQGTLKSSIVDAFETGGKNIFEIWKQMLLNIVAETYAAKITRAVFGEGGSGTNAFGDVVSQLGTVLSLASLGGGTVAPEGTADVSRLSDPNGLRLDLGGGTNVTNNFNIVTPNATSFQSARGRISADANRSVRTGL